MKIIKGKCIYWADPMVSEETVEIEYQKHVEPQFQEHGYQFANVKCMDIPPYNEIDFDFLLFDYGGLLPGCESLIQTNCRWLIEDARNHPSRCYVMVSSFTRQAMEDYLTDLDSSELHNIFMDVKSFINYYKGVCE
jgi:hypothetical protein